MRVVATERHGELVRLSAELSAACDTLTQLRVADEKLDDEHAEVVTEPASALRRQLDRLIDRATDIEALLDTPSYPRRPGDSSLADEAAWCAAMLRHVTDLTVRCDLAAEQARLDAAAASEPVEKARRRRHADQHPRPDPLPWAGTAHRANHDCEAAGTLAFRAHYAAPGYGQSWECRVCGQTGRAWAFLASRGRRPHPHTRPMPLTPSPR